MSDFAWIIDLDSGSDDHMYLLQDPANCVHSFLQMQISQLLKDRVEIHPKFRRKGGPAVARENRAGVQGQSCVPCHPDIRLYSYSTPC